MLCLAAINRTCFCFYNMSLRLRSSVYGGVPEWPKGTDCKSAASCFGGSNPPSSTRKKDFAFAESFFLWNKFLRYVKLPYGQWNALRRVRFISFHLMRSIKFHKCGSTYFTFCVSKIFHKKFLGVVKCLRTWGETRLTSLCAKHKTSRLYGSVSISRCCRRGFVRLPFFPKT